MKTPRAWYRFNNQTDDPTVSEIHISDAIGSWDDDWFARNFGYDMGVTARAFVEDLSKLPAAVSTLKVHINSPGGDIQAGIQIANALREQQMSKGRTVETYVDGIAASIASVIAMAGSKVHIGDNALMMMHNPWGDVTGDAQEMRKTADILDAMRNQIVATYKWHTSLDDAAIVALMDAETWMGADEAIAEGFATEKVAGLHASNNLARGGVLNAFKVPDKFRARVDALLVKEEAPKPAPVAAAPRDVMVAVAAAGLDNAFAIDLVDAALPMEQATARIETAKAAKSAAAARANDIAAVCKLARRPKSADGYVASGMTVEQVKAHLVVIAAEGDAIEIDGSVKPDGAKKSDQAVVDLSDSYQKLNQPAKRGQGYGHAA